MVTVEMPVHGVVTHNDSERKTDYLYRVSLKCVIRNKNGEVVVVKEAGERHWDLPGGGMDHGEDIASTIARELHEEVNLNGEFSYRVIAIEEPKRLDEHSFWQIRLIFAVMPHDMTFSAGDDGDEVKLVDPATFKYSTSRAERRVYHYASL